MNTRGEKQKWGKPKGGIASGLLLAAFLLLLGAGRALALDPARDVSQYNCQTWSRQNGLPVNGINAIRQTQDGYLWLGTTLGLVRFDGVDFKLMDISHVAGLRNTIVTSLAAAHKGGLWVGLDHSSFGFWDGQSFSFRGRESWGQIDMNVRSILESKDGTLRFATEKGAFQLTGSGVLDNLLASDSFANQTPDVLCGYEDHQGRLWFGTANRGVLCWQAGAWVTLSDSDLTATSVMSIAVDREGQIWLGTANGLYCYDSNFRRKEIPVLVDETRALLVDRHGLLWIGTSGRGVGRYQNGAYQFLQKIDGLAGNYVNTLTEDREGSLWVGTRDGVSQISDVKFPIQHAAEDPAIKDAICVAASHRGGVWIGSPGGVTYFDGTAKTYATETGMPTRYVKRVFEASNGDVYVVCGVHRLAILSQGNSFALSPSNSLSAGSPGEEEVWMAKGPRKVIAAYTNSTMFVGMAEDPHGVVVSVGGELYRAGTNYFTPYAFRGAAPDFYWILSLTTGRDGALWVACGNGIFRVKDGEYQHFAPNTLVQWLCEDSDGVVWGALLTGIVRVKDNQLAFISRKDGLLDDNIYSIVPDNLGNLWADSGRGIFRVSRRSMNDFADGRTGRVECTAYDGLESVKNSDKTVQERVACKTTDGRIWFPNPNGVTVIDPANIPVNRIAPPVNIDHVHANGKDVAASGHIIIPPGNGDLQFHFNALSFIAPHKTRFRYRLEGYDKDWVEASDRRIAFYTNLKPRDYTFRVIAANADGVWNKTGDQLHLELRPHFFQTAWFYLLGGGMTVAVLVGAYLWRIRQLQRRQQALQKNRDWLEAEVRNRTAELAQANGSLQHESEEHKHTAVELRQRTQSLEREIEERTQMQLEVERVHRQLVETSRQAGMAEVATNVLHNVGNVLNSVNTSASVIVSRVKNSKAERISRVADLFEQNRGNLAQFLTTDGRADQVVNYLKSLVQRVASERKDVLNELQELTQNIEHIKDIVVMQQSYARVSGVTEKVKPVALLEDALRMNDGALNRHGVQLVREYDPDLPEIIVEKHKVLQILVNLIRNAKYACDDGGRSDKRLTVRVSHGDDRIRIAIIDNGVGIPPENLTRIFNHGFTTRKNGHGFGLHSGALAAKEIGGALHAHSVGHGNGATFTLELPLAPPRDGKGALAAGKNGSLGVEKQPRAFALAAEFSSGESI